MAETSAEPPFLRVGPEMPASPVVISVPHAGRAYSERLLRASRLSRRQLEQLEDRLVDRLIWRAIEAGSSAIVARAPRAEIDLNRDEREVDAAMVSPPPPSRALIASPRTRGGLGLVPSRIGGLGPIWLQRLPSAELEARIATIHRPYHEAIAGLLDAAQRRFGIAVLLDCHSMPPRRAGSNDGAEIVFGDRYGTSIAPDLLDVARRTGEAAGFTTGCNTPYAGGYITARHGRPANGVHALQIEIDRSLYLDKDLRDPGSGFDRMSRLIAAIADAVAARAAEPPQSVAAE